MNIFIFGDSHVLRLLKTIDIQCQVNECNCKTVYGLREQDRHMDHIGMHAGLPMKVYLSYHAGRSSWKTNKILNEDHPCIKKIIDLDTIILPMFGYIDCKIQLNRPDNNNPEETVIQYMDSIISSFPNNKVRFIEPIPQFIDDTLIGNGIEIHEFQSRYKNHLKFVHYLKEQSKIRGLEDPIMVSEVLGTDKLDESYECHECDYCLYEKQSIGIRWDHLKFKYNKNILDHILKNYLP
jgi:hypothetical protein